MNKTNLMQVRDALKQLDAELRSAWNARTLPAHVLSAESILQLQAAIAICEAELARVDEPVGQVVSSGPANLPIFQWLSADHSFRVPIGSKLYATPQEAVSQPGQAGESMTDYANLIANLRHCAKHAQVSESVYFTKAADALIAAQPSQAHIPTPPVVVKNPANSDELYDKAVAIVKEHQRASISLVQRHLRISYNHAARLIEGMAEAGLIASNNNGSYSLAAINAKGTP